MRSPFILLPIALLLVRPMEALAQTSATGRVTGRVTMTTGDVLPGGTITLSSKGTPTTVVTGADGRFVVEAFVDGSSAVLSASLAGFRTTSRDVETRPGGTVNLGDIRLQVGCLSIVDFVATGLREEASRAQSVTHLRIESVQPVREWTIDKSCYVGSEVSAVVVTDLRGRKAGTRIRFVPIKSPTLPPYAPGDEIVVVLNQDRASRHYFSWGYGYSVINGVVALTAPLDEFEEEIPVGVLFERLRETR
jgi:hypothetical protein